MSERPPSDLKRVAAQYHAAVQGLTENALADLQGRWQGVQATLDLRIKQLTDQIAEAQARGETVNVAWLTQAQRLEQLRAAVQGDVSAFADGAVDIVQQAVSGAIDLGQAAAQAALAASVPPGVAFTFGVPPSDVAEELAAALQPGSPLAALFDQLGPQVAAFAQQALFTGVALGEGPRQIAQRLIWSTDMAARRAEVIARTETMRAWRHAQFANYQANRDVVQQWMWAADFGPRCCGACIAMDGTFHDLDSELDDHICGRCSALPITRPWSDILSDAGMSQAEIEALDLTETSGMAWAQSRESGESWLSRQSVEIQNQILGPAKAEAWRQGAFPLKRVVGVVHDSQWGSSIRELSLRQMGIDAQTWLQAARQAGNDSRIADEEALAAAHAETSASVVAEQRAEQIAEAKAAADEWYAAIARSIADGRAGGLTAEEAKAAADEWFQQVQRQATPGALSVEDVARAMEQRFGLVAEPAALEATATAAFSADLGSAIDIRAWDASHGFFGSDAHEDGTRYEWEPIAQRLERQLGDNADVLALASKLDYYDRAAEEIRPAATAGEAVQALLNEYHGGYSTNATPLMVAIQQAVANEFGLTVRDYVNDADLLAEADRLYGDVQPGLRAIVRQMHTDTQAWFQERGITEVRLFRGMSWRGQDLPSELAALDWSGAAQAVDIATQAASSWSVSPSIANTFTGGRRYELIAGARVPVERILSVPETGFGSFGEYEALTLGGIDPVVAVAKDIAQYSYPGDTPFTLDELYQKLASGETTSATDATTVSYASDVARERLAQLFDQLDSPLTDAQVANLAGAPAGSTVTVSKHGEITVTPPDGRYTSSLFITPGEDGPTLLNWRFEGPDGTNIIPVDPEALAMQVRQASELGVDGIHMKSRIGSADYAELPQLGYNAPIEQVLTESRDKTLPAGLERAPTLLDVLATPAGRAWWAENGLNPGLDFDLHPGSLSRQILDAYLRDHGLPGLEE